jgi:hypothetical protein
VGREAAGGVDHVQDGQAGAAQPGELNPKRDGAMSDMRAIGGDQDSLKYLRDRTGRIGSIRNNRSGAVFHDILRGLPLGDAAPTPVA